MRARPLSRPRPVAAPRAWAAVHHSRLGAVVVVLTGLASLLTANLWIRQMGTALLASPVPVLLVLPVVAGVGAAIACANPTVASLPDPPRAVLARAGWAVGWTAAAAGAACVGLIAGPQIGWEPIGRNVLFNMALAIIIVLVGQIHLIWLPPLLLALSSMMFGIPDDPDRTDPYWWAFSISDEVTGVQWTVVVSAYVAAVAAYALIPHQRARRRGRRIRHLV